MALPENSIVKLNSGSSIENFVRITRAQRFNLPINESALGSSPFTISGAGGTRGPNNITALNPPKTELLEINGVGFDCGGGYLQLILRQPSSVTQLGTSRLPTGGVLTSEESPRNNPMALSLFTVYERPPAISWTNNYDAALQPTVLWQGWRYEIENLSAAEISAILTNKTQNVVSVSVGGFRS